MTDDKYLAFLSLGSNMGDKETNISQAILLISELEKVELVAQSSLYETSPVGFVQQPHFLNCCIKIMTNLDPLELLDKLQEIENYLGRTRREYWGARTIDIDILLCGDKLIREPRLKVPHPLMFERGFVMLPLAEIMTSEERNRYGVEGELAKFKGLSDKDIKKHKK